ncbi:hypothetical protein BH23PLA1_BH23PLA1_11570 [soil metagenome]
MSPRRQSSKPPSPTAGSSTSSASPPLLNATLLGSAIGYGLWLLVQRGGISWPPRELLAGGFTLAGCLALVGPIVLNPRAAASEGGLGEFLWMTGGLLVWVFDLAAVSRGEMRSVNFATPLDPETLGLIVLAVLLAGWRARSRSWNWAWTNVIGWILAIFWIGLALMELLPDRLPSLLTG